MTDPLIRKAFESALRQNFGLFLRRSVATVAPGVRYQHNWHVDAIAAHLAACAKGDITRLIINLPPRMLKSTIISVAWPAWLLGHNPKERLMVASYAQSLSIKHSTDCRTLLRADWYQRVFPETRLADDQNEKEKFTTTARGYRIAVSVGGAALGEGGKILIVDDPLNPLQASYGVQREQVNQWFDHTFATRLDDKQRGAIVVVMQRLHPQDLSGYLLEKGDWVHLSLPAIAPTRTSIVCGDFHHTREQGDALHEAREDRAVLERTRRELGAANFSAQYQQQPQIAEGTLVKPVWFSLRASAPSQGMRVHSWDTGIKAQAHHDASACATFVQEAGRHYLSTMRTVRLEYPELKRAIIAYAEQDAVDVILIEDKASGQSLIQDLKRETKLPIVACSATDDKVMRLVRVTPMLEDARVILPETAPWLTAFEQELFGFPQMKHDDQVDAFSQYLNWVRTLGHSKKPGIRVL